MVSNGDIYGAESVEHLALAGEFDAQKWAAQFVKTHSEIPEIASDEETMLAWFASAIMAGYDRGRADRAENQEASR